MSAHEWKLVRVSSADVVIDRGVFLSLWVNCEWKGGGQGFGGFILHNIDKPEGSGNAAAADYIASVMRVLDVDRLSEAAGKYVEILHSHSEIIEIRQPSCDGDKRFSVKEWRERWFPESGR